MIGSRFCVLKIDLENGAHSTTSVVALPANENLTGGRWKSAARATANMNCIVRPKAAIHGRIFGSLQRRRWSLTQLGRTGGVQSARNTNAVRLYQRCAHMDTAHDQLHS